MTPSSLNPFHLPNGKPKTVIVTGGAGAIGAETVRSYHSYGCNVVIADLPYAQDAANNLIGALGDGGRAMYNPSDTTDWENMKSLFRETKKRFGQIDIVVANAGLMESKGFFEFKEDSQEELEEPAEAYKVVDVNVKGTMNSKYCIHLQPQSLISASIAISDAHHVIQSTRRRRLSRLNRPHLVSRRVLRQKRRCRVHRIKARCNRTHARIAS
jgi:NAD(P)-dependent dehydrogenase (short-subunit alcohol dehydrogenase family)